MTSKDQKEYDKLTKIKKLTVRQSERLAYLSMRRHRDLRNEYGPLYDWLQCTLYLCDVENLCRVEGHMGYDEYVYETEQILPHLRKLWKKRPVEWKKVARVVRKVFRRAFNVSRQGRGYPKRMFDVVAKKIADFLNGKDFTISLVDIGALNFLL